MGVVYILLFIQGITGGMVLYQPQNIVSMDVDGTAVITCVSKENVDGGSKISWYSRRWGSREDLVHVKSCSHEKDSHRYACLHEKYMTSLRIYNVQVNDSAVYYCALLYTPDSWKLGNGTHLDVGDGSTSRSSFQIIGHLQPLYPHSFLHLACVVLAARNTVHLYWNISGTYHKGQIISKEESDGTWTVMNFISLPRYKWNHGESLTCESSPTSVHWKIPGPEELHGYVASKCEIFLILVVIAGILLLLTLSAHLMRTLKLTDNKAPGLMGKKTVMKDEIAYAELTLNHLPRLKTPTSPMKSKDTV